MNNRFASNSFGILKGIPTDDIIKDINVLKRKMKMENVHFFHDISHCFIVFVVFSEVY